MVGHQKKGVCFLAAGALLSLGGALFDAPPAQAYLLTLEISDSFGDTATATTGPFSAAGSNTFIDSSAIFPEFTSFVVSVTAGQSAGNSFLNEVDISGIVTNTAGPPIDMTITLLGQGFTLPGPMVDATQDLSSSSLPGSFMSADLQATLNGTTIANQTISPPNAGVPSTLNGISVGGLYDADAYVTITGIARSTIDHLNNFNLTSNVTWTPNAVPEPASMTLLLTAVPAFLLGLRRRRNRSPQ